VTARRDEFSRRSRSSSARSSAVTTSRISRDAFPRPCAWDIWSSAVIGSGGAGCPPPLPRVSPGIG
jgi:hypothetical protein